MTLLLAAAAALAVMVGVGSAAAGSRPDVRFRPARIGLFHHTSVTVRGLSARSVEVRLKGATDAAGLAYEWTPYRWRRLQFSDGAWRGALPAPALLGVYELQVRLDGRRRVLQSPDWLVRVLPKNTPARPSFPTAVAVVRDFVARLPGDEVVVALRRVRPARYDRRDTRLHRIFAVAYAPRGDTQPSARLGLFVTAVRDAYHGRWRLLDTGVEPNG
jgi:hypothetical protein